MDKNKLIKDMKQSLANTAEFANLQRVNNEIKKNPSVYAKLMQFQQSQAQLASSNLTESQAQQLMSRLESDYENLMKIPIAQSYFSAFNEFNNLLGSIIHELNSILMQELQ